MTFWSKRNDHRYAEIEAIVNIYFNFQQKISKSTNWYDFLITWYEYDIDTVLQKR